MLAGFEQFVHCDTRKTNILDKYYENPYVAKSKPPLSNSDHNVVHLIPYCQFLSHVNQSTKRLIYGQRIPWKHLRAIFFCADNVVEKKDVVVYPNNKPYITKDIKECIHHI